MKLPTEGELIELENRVLRGWQARADSDGSQDYEFRIVQTLEALISIARNPSQMLKYIPIGDAMDALENTLESVQPPRKDKAKPVSRVHPKNLKKSRKFRKS
jgi:hypothetical protein